MAKPQTQTASSAAPVPCPACGRCPTCGHRLVPTPFIPWAPRPYPRQPDFVYC